jgi:hypothetical protein
MNKHVNYSDSTEQSPAPDPAGFTPDIAPDEWAASLRAARITLLPVWNQPFEVLKPSHLVGLARTNTTLIDPTIVQTDVLAPAVPFAAFDMQRTQDGRAAVSHHFQASGYGSAGIGKFIFSFTVQTLGDETGFTFGPEAQPAGTLIAPGNVRIHGSARTFTLTATLARHPANAEASIFVQQTSGAPWRWFQTAVRVPPPVLDPTIISA